MAFVYERKVRFEDVDAATIVFFPRVLAYCHEAMAELVDRHAGGYSSWVVERRIGLPTVHLEVDFTSPLRFGDVARVAVDVERLGTSSCTFAMTVSRAADGAPVAKVKLVTVATDLSAMRSLPFPAPLRRALEAYATRLTPA